MRAWAPSSSVGREGGRLGQVVEGDDDRRDVEHRLRQAYRVGRGHGHPVPARGGLVGQVAHAGREREGEGRVVHAWRQQAPEGLQRVVGRIALQLGVVGVLDHRHVAIHHEHAASDPHERVAPVACAALDALEDEGQPVAQAQRGGDRGEGVGAPLDRDDAAARPRRARGHHHDPSTRSMSRSTASR